MWLGGSGMITSKRIDETFRKIGGLDWTTALRAASNRKLSSEATIQLSL